MQWKDDSAILANPDILSENHLPLVIRSGQSQLKEKALCLRPLTEIIKKSLDGRKADQIMDRLIQDQEFREILARKMGELTNPKTVT